MRKLLSLLLLFCLLIPGRSTAENHEPMLISSISLPEGETVSTFCTDTDGGFYLLTTYSLYHYRMGQDAVLQGERLGDRNELAGIYFYRDVLYGITQTHTAVYHDQGNWLILGKNSNAKDELHRCHVTAANGRLFYTYKEDQGTDEDIVCMYAFDLSSGVGEEMQAFDGIEIYADEQKNCLYHLSAANVGALYTLNLENGDELQRIEESIPPFLNSYYSAATQIFYMTTRDGLYSWDGQNAVELRWKVKGVSRIIPLSNGGIVVVDATNLSVYDFQASVNTASSISVMGFQSVYQRMFTQSSGIEVNEVKQGSSTMVDEIAQRLTNHDSTVDIYAIWSDMGFSAIKKKGYYTNLSQSEALTSASLELYPAIREVIQDADGTLVAWPFFAYTHLMTEDREILQAYHFEIPSSYDDLLDLIPQIWDSGLLEENGYVMFDTISCCREDLFRTFVRQYIRESQMRGQTPSFSDTEFLRIAKRILTEIPLTDPFPRGEDGEESPLFMLDCVSNRLLEATHAPLAVTAMDTPAVEVELLLLVINPYSEKKNEAIQYLEYLSAKRTTEDYALFTTMTDPAIDPVIHKQYEEACEALEAEKALAQTEPDIPAHQEKISALSDEVMALKQQQVLVSQHAIDNYHGLSDSFVVLLEEDITQSQRMEMLLSRVLEGSLPLNQFSQSADEYIRMMMTE